MGTSNAELQKDVETLQQRLKAHGHYQHTDDGLHFYRAEDATLYHVSSRRNSRFYRFVEAEVWPDRDAKRMLDSPAAGSYAGNAPPLGQVIDRLLFNKDKAPQLQIAVTRASGETLQFPVRQIARKKLIGDRGRSYSKRATRRVV
jgi:hypothetical protein